MKTIAAAQPSQTPTPIQLKFSQYNKKVYAKVPAVMLSSLPRAIPITIWSFLTEY